jgi:hypothetical protein
VRGDDRTRVHARRVVLGVLSDRRQREDRCRIVAHSGLLFELPLRPLSEPKRKSGTDAQGSWHISEAVETRRVADLRVASVQASQRQARNELEMETFAGPATSAVANSA